MQIRYEQDRFSFPGDLIAIPEELIDILLKQNKIIDAFMILESAKSRTLVERLGFSEIPIPGTVPAEKQKEDEQLRKKIRSKEHAIQNTKTDSQRDRLMKELNELLKRYEILTDDIFKYAPDYVDMRHGKTLTFREVKSILL